MWDAKKADSSSNCLENRFFINLGTKTFNFGLQKLKLIGTKTYIFGVYIGHQCFIRKMIFLSWLRHIILASNLVFCWHVLGPAISNQEELILNVVFLAIYIVQTLKLSNMYIALDNLSIVEQFKSRWHQYFVGLGFNVSAEIFSNIPPHVNRGIVFLPKY